MVQDGDRWYADIEFAIPPTAATYGPFVQLALARFQPDSLPGLSLSPVVASDPVRLMPDRQLTVERAGGGLVVSLTGTAPSPPTRVEALLERCDLPAGISPEAVDLISIDGNPAAAAAAGGVPAWRPVPGHVVAGDVTGTLPVLPLPSGTGPLRLRVREIEQISGSAAAPGDPATAAELRERTVFVDLVPIPSAWLPS